jgi:putative lipoprotein
VRGAAGVRQGAEGLSARATLGLLLAVVALAGCRRPTQSPRAELGGAWLREPERAQGFELRSDGTLALLGWPDLSGLAWSASHGELVLSTNDERRIESSVARLRVAALEGDRLELAGEGESLAGVYRRAQAAHVRGVVTYRERMALGPDARVVVELTRIGVGRVALQAFLARGQVPIGFDLSVLAGATAGAEYELRARIGDRERTLFSTAEPVRVTPGDDGVEILLRSAR